MYMHALLSEKWRYRIPRFILKNYFYIRELNYYNFYRIILSSLKTYNMIVNASYYNVDDTYFFHKRRIFSKMYIFLWT